MRQKRGSPHGTAPSCKAQSLINIDDLSRNDLVRVFDLRILSRQLAEFHSVGAGDSAEGISPLHDIDVRTRSQNRLAYVLFPGHLDCISGSCRRNPAHQIRLRVRARRAASVRILSRRGRIRPGILREHKGGKSGSLVWYAALTLMDLK